MIPPPDAEPQPADGADPASLLARASRGATTVAAIDLLDAALAQLEPDDPARAPLVARRARVLLTLDRNVEAAATAQELLTTAVDRPTRLHLTATIALARLALGGPPVALPPVDEWLDASLPTEQPDDDTRLALADYAVVQVANGDPVEAERTTRVATDDGQGGTSNRQGDNDDEVLTIVAGTAATVAQLHLGRTTDAVKGAAQLTAALDRCERLTEVAGYAPWVVLGLVAGLEGDPDRALAAFDKGRAMLRALALDWLTGLTEAATASTLADAGRWDEALAVVEAVERGHQAGDSDKAANVSFLPMVLGVRALVEARRGDTESATRTIEQAERWTARPFNGADHVVRARAALSAARGKHDESVAAFTALADRDDELGVEVWTPTILLAALLAADEAADASSLRTFARRAPIEHAGTPPSTAAARAARAFVDGDSAALLTAARDIVDCLPYESARLVAAAVDRSTGLDRTAVEAARDALATFDRLGAPADADRLRRALERMAGDLPPADVRAAWARLTPAEQRVSRLVAEGLSNREVAEATGSSQRTVEAHLRSVFAKLHVPSRLRLAVLVRDLDPGLGGSTDDSGGGGP